jgi:hypothetical protein
MLHSRMFSARAALRERSDQRALRRLGRSLLHCRRRPAHGFSRPTPPQLPLSALASLSFAAETQSSNPFPIAEGGARRTGCLRSDVPPLRGHFFPFWHAAQRFEGLESMSAARAIYPNLKARRSFVGANKVHAANPANVISLQINLVEYALTQKGGRGVGAGKIGVYLTRNFNFTDSPDRRGRHRRERLARKAPDDVFDAAKLLMSMTFAARGEEKRVARGAGFGQTISC